MTISTPSNIVIASALILVVTFLLLTLLAIWNHQRLARTAAAASSAFDVEGIGAELVEAIKTASANRGTVVDITRFWTASGGHPIPRRLRYLIVEKLINSGIVYQVPREHDGPTNLTSFINYAFLQPPRLVRLTDIAWERMIHDHASSTALVENLKGTVIQAGDYMVNRRYVIDNVSIKGSSGTLTDRATRINSLSYGNKGHALAEALTQISGFVNEVNDSDAAEYLDGLIDELGRAEPRKARLTLFLNGIVEILPKSTGLTDSAEEIGSFFR